MKILHYRIEEKLSKGGEGEVYRAHDERLKRDVAIKFLRQRFATQPAAVARFIRESKAASALNHPNIVTVISAGKTRAGQFIVMELVRGKTLREWAAAKPASQALLQITLQIAQALSAAHAAGIIHRDIKPENIMVREDGYVKVLDFGLARWEDTKSIAESITQTISGTIVGTLRYMSPEQAQGERVLVSSDVFSLGIVLYELFTGKHPFAGGNELTTLQAICSGPIVSPRYWSPEMSPSLEKLILRMLSRDPRQRPASEELVLLLLDVGSMTSASIAETPVSIRQPLVGRHRELVKLRALLNSTIKSNGLIVLITGEPGIGKTALVEDFLNEQIILQRSCAIGRGFSSERLAGTEAYLPIFEALEDMIRTTPSLIQTMRQMAPNWYAHVKRNSSEDTGSSPPGQLKTASRELLSRELMAFLREASQSVPLVLFLDDLHWADDSTIDLLTYISSHFDSTRILILATYRPEELQLNHEQFSQIVLDLQARRLCQKIDLSFLTLADVEAFISLEFPENSFPPVFPKLIHTKTEGNPFFMVEVLRYLQDKQILSLSEGTWRLSENLPGIERDLPQSVVGMVRRKIDSLSAQYRKLLSAASVEGFEFHSSVIALALGADPVEVEESLEKLHRVHGVVQPIGQKELPDGAIAVTYRFVHFLYYDAFYVAIQPARKASWCGSVARALLHFYQNHDVEIAAQLALLFESAREFPKAARYFSLAAENATKVFAHNEAVSLARRGLRMLEGIPDTAARKQVELDLQLKLGIPLLASRGYGNLEVQGIYDRARELCFELGEDPRLFPALWGLASYYAARLELTSAFDIAEQLLRLSRDSEDINMVFIAHIGAGVSRYLLGQFDESLTYLGRYRSLDNTSSRVSGARRFGLEPGIVLRGFEARLLTRVGYPDKGFALIEEAMSLARSLSHAPTLAFVMSIAATILQSRGDIEGVDSLAKELTAQGNDYGMQIWTGQGLFFEGWANFRRNPKESTGIEQMRDGLTAYGATGTQLYLPYGYATLAECCGLSGQPAAGLQVVNEAQLLQCFKVSASSFFTSELLRVEADLLMAMDDLDTAESRLIQALAIARQQQNRSSELCIATSLSRLRKIQGRPDEARQILSPIFESFSEGFDTPDFKEARAELQR